MDIERVNSVLVKAIVGLQESEVDGLVEAARGKKSKALGEDGVEAVRKICKEHQHAKVKGVDIDASTACLMVKIVEKLNPQNKAKFLALDVNTAAHLAWKLAS